MNKVNKQGGGEKVSHEISITNNKLDLSKMNVNWYYLKYESVLGSLIKKCFKVTERETFEKNVLDKGSDQLLEDFNYRHIMERIRLCNYESGFLNKKHLVGYCGFPQMRVLTINDGEDETKSEEDKSKQKNAIKGFFQKKMYGATLNK